MTRLEALIDLRDKVKAGEFPRWVVAAKAIGLNQDDRHIKAYQSFHGSLDAALALHEAVLPEWSVEVFNLSGEVVLRKNRPVDTAYGEALRSGLVARAWLIAILESLIAQERDV